MRPGIVDAGQGAPGIAAPGFEGGDGLAGQARDARPARAPAAWPARRRWPRAAAPVAQRALEAAGLLAVVVPMVGGAAVVLGSVMTKSGLLGS